MAEVVNDRQGVTHHRIAMYKTSEEKRRESRFHNVPAPAVVVCNFSEEVPSTSI